MVKVEGIKDWLNKISKLAISKYLFPVVWFTVRVWVVLRGQVIGDKLRKRGNCQEWYLDRSKIVRNSGKTCS
jgi:hypothetical protein